MKKFLQDLAIKGILGVKPERQNFQRSGLFVAAIVIFAMYLLIVYVNFFEVIDGIIEISSLPWYTGITAKISFLLISVRIVSLSLFTKSNNMLDRFVAAFVTQLFGLIGSIVIISIRDTIVSLSPDIEWPLQIFYFFLPYVVTVGVMITMNHIYHKENFKLAEFFRRSK